MALLKVGGYKEVCQVYHEAQTCFCSQSWKPQGKTLAEFDEMEGETVYK